MKQLAILIGLASCAADRAATSSSPACAAAEGYQNLAAIEANIFAGSCTFSSCHAGGANPVDLTAGKAHAALVGVASHLDPSRTLVVPGSPDNSFLLVMLGAVSPKDMSPPLDAVPAPGVMPLSGTPLCAEKLDAIRRWIEAGAAND